MNQQPEQQEYLDKEVPKPLEQHEEVNRQFNGRWFACNKPRHMKKECIGKYTKPLSGYFYNCFSYGHKSNEYKKPRYNNNNNGIYESTNPATSKPLGEKNVIRNRVMCYKCNNFGHIARKYRLQTNQFGPRYGNDEITCQIFKNFGHTKGIYRMKNMITSNMRSQTWAIEGMQTIM